MKRRLTAVGVLASLTLAACGGGDEPTAGTASATTEAATVATETPATDAPAATDTTVAATDPADTAADTTAAATVPSADFDGPVFVDVIDAALAPYAALIGQPASVEALATALPAVLPDTPLPAGLTIAGAGIDVELWAPGDVVEEQKASFAELLDVTQLEAFAAAPPAGWRQASVSTSGSLATVLMTNEADPRRVVYTSDSESTPDGRPSLELNLDPGDTADLPQPAWLASLPALEGGELVEVQEGIGTVNFFGVPGRNGWVLARWRYPVDAIDDLNAFLESGVVQAAGFTYDLDLFNGFENLVEVTAGDWTGSVLIGSGSAGDEEFYDLVWSLTRS
jgi:hypothetical protein